MRVAVTTGLLPIPPTYFVVQHGERMLADHVVEAFPLVAEVTDASVRLPVTPAISTPLPWRVRQYLALVAGPAQSRLLARFEPDLLHQHFATWSAGALRTAAALAVPSVVTLHGYDVFEALSPHRGALGRVHARSIRAAQSGADVTLAVSEFLAGEALRAGWPADRLAVHYQGVDTDFFTPDLAGSQPAEPTIAFVGALAQRKGILDLITASIALQSTRPHHLRIAGSGALEPRVRSAADLYPHISFEGALDRHGVRRLLRESTVFALPTQSDGAWREAAGLVLLEAQACGVPAVTYVSGGAPEMVRHGETGAVVPERDVSALGRALDDVLALDQPAWRSMSASARNFVVQHRSVPASTDALLEHYAAASAT